MPGDFGIISFDNIEISSFVNPRLTTIEQNQTDMGTELFHLVQAISENKNVSDKIILPQKLIIRDSC